MVEPKPDSEARHRMSESVLQTSQAQLNKLLQVSLDIEENELAKNAIDHKALRHFLKQLFDRLHAADEAIKRGIIRQLFKNIMVYKKNQIKVTWTIPAVNECEIGFVSDVRWLPSFESAPNPGPLPKIVIDLEFKAALLVADKAFLYQEYVVANKSIARIAHEQLCAKSTVSKYLLEFEIERRTEHLPSQRRGQIPFGMRLRKGQLMPHHGEQAVIIKLQGMRNQGKSFADLVSWHCSKGIRTKNGGKWDRPTVYKILKRSRRG